MYLLSDAAGWSGQEALWRLQHRGDVAVEMPAKIERVMELMYKYRAVPMDLADATLVVPAEERELETVFSLDRRFRTYRRGRGRPFTILP